MGSGYKTFTAGAVLTASDVQNYLQDQSVMVFSGTAARSSAIGTANFEEGMLTYLTDVDKLQVYTGATFADVYPAAATNQGLTLINTTSFSAVSSQSVNDVFSSTYENYLLLTRITDMSIGDNVQIRMRASGSDDSTANYHNLGLRITTTVDRVASYGQTSYRIGETGTKKGAFQTVIYGPQLAALTQFNGLITNGFNNPMENGFQMGAHNVATAYTGFTIFPASGTMTGNVSVYGYNK